MTKKKADRNRTIDLTVEEGQHYRARCLSLSTPASLAEVVNRTIIGNMLTVCPCLPRQSVDLLIIDPPYNLSKDFHGTAFVKKNAETYEQYTREWIEAALPVLKATATIYVCCDWQTSLIIGNMLPEYFKVRNRITWQREKGRGANANWKNGMEDIWYATPSDQYTFNLADVKLRKKVIAPYKIDGKPKDWQETETGKFRDTCPSNFWGDITIPFWSMPENTAHPTQKPEKLLAKLILASSNAGDLVFDPFLGSGTTSVVARKLNRNYIGIEQNERYCVWAEKRLELAETDSSIQGYTGGVFWERNTPVK